MNLIRSKFIELASLIENVVNKLDNRAYDVILECVLLLIVDSNLRIKDIKKLYFSFKHPRLSATSNLHNIQHCIHNYILPSFIFYLQIMDLVRQMCLWIMEN